MSETTDGLPALADILASLADAPVTLELVASWVGNGPNEPLTADVLLAHIDPDRLQALATQAGTSQQDAAVQLASAIPQLIDLSTPPPTQELEDADNEGAIAVFAAAIDYLYTNEITTTGAQAPQARSGPVNVMTAIDANSSIAKIDVAIQAVTDQRSNLGAFSNRLQSAIRSSDYAVENLTASDSQTRDTDIAGEMVEFTKNNILTQASQAMLAQSNQLPQGVVQLLR
ncbi:flagellin [Streptomyces sp. NBC_00536]|uniref:flagellin n=1 Tax=Streptomyces sp. NBC_00536 TaxID=2975769 RepID=UPI002E81ACE9|nr:flagellin [Streptomyces sp. NBC_00536]WUC76921.1 flagellin [Streptomyces sp. NBC_00536]